MNSINCIIILIAIIIIISIIIVYSFGNYNCQQLQKNNFMNINTTDSILNLYTPYLFLGNCGGDAPFVNAQQPTTAGTAGAPVTINAQLPIYASVTFYIFGAGGGGGGQGWASVPLGSAYMVGNGGGGGAGGMCSFTTIQQFPSITITIPGGGGGGGISSNPESRSSVGGGGGCAGINGNLAGTLDASGTPQSTSIYSGTTLICSVLGGYGGYGQNQYGYTYSQTGQQGFGGSLQYLISNATIIDNEIGGGGHGENYPTNSSAWGGCVFPSFQNNIGSITNTFNGQSQIINAGQIFYTCNTSNVYSIQNPYNLGGGGPGGTYDGSGGSVGVLQYQTTPSYGGNFGGVIIYCR